jgi:hypothetical protein
MSLDPNNAVNGKEALTGKEEIGGDVPTLPHPVQDRNYPAGKVRFHRTTLFQILVVGVCAFTAPGIWSAMNGLGVGGSQSPDLVNAANAILYAFMTFTCKYHPSPWLYQRREPNPSFDFQ